MTPCYRSRASGPLLEVAHLPAGDFEIRADDFKAILTPESRVEKIAGGFGFTEGPIWMDDHLLFSDLHKDRILKWTEGNGVSVFRDPSGKVNGNTRDLEGRLITAGHVSRNLQRTEMDGSVTVLAERYQDKLLNSPNDVVVKSDGSIWFTDPPYTITPEQQELPSNYVFRFDPLSGDMCPVAHDLDRPNGLCFSPDESLLYVADSARRNIWMFAVVGGEHLGQGCIFTNIDPGIPDGIRVDTEGRLYSTAADGIHLFTPTGNLLGKILTPESPANCSFGGNGNHILFITARTSVYAVGLAASGVPGR